MDVRTGGVHLLRRRPWLRWLGPRCDHDCDRVCGLLRRDHVRLHARVFRLPSGGRLPTSAAATDRAARTAATALASDATLAASRPTAARIAAAANLHHLRARELPRIALLRGLPPRLLLLAQEWPRRLRLRRVPRILPRRLGLRAAQRAAARALARPRRLLRRRECVCTSLLELLGQPLLHQLDGWMLPQGEPTLCHVPPARAAVR